MQDLKVSSYIGFMWWKKMKVKQVLEEVLKELDQLEQRNESIINKITKANKEAKIGTLNDLILTLSNITTSIRTAKNIIKDTLEVYEDLNKDIEW